MTQVQVLDASPDRTGGYKVDVGRGERIGRVPSGWFGRPADERYRSLDSLNDPGCVAILWTSASCSSRKAGSEGQVRWPTSTLSGAASSPKQQQPWPGLARAMNPRPDHGEDGPLTTLASVRR